MYVVDRPFRGQCLVPRNADVYSSIGGRVQHQELVARLSEAAVAGELGLFVGTGASIALTKDSLVREAPRFHDLLERVADELEIEFPDCAGLSYPQVASEIVRRLADRDSCEEPNRKKAFERARLSFKEMVAWMCHFVPNAGVRETFATALSTIDPAWVVTTNYDLLFDGLFDDPRVLLPTQFMTTARRTTPIYHIHGHRNDPNSIVITEEDYVEALQPHQYRQLKMSLLFSESSTLVLGYSLSDINVLSAMMWGQLNTNGGSRLVVQAVRKGRGTAPASSPYLGPYGQWIVEIEEIEDLLGELATSVSRAREALCHKLELLEALKSPEGLERARADRDTRMQLFKLISETGSPAIPVLDEILEPAWAATEPYGAWAAYNAYLHIVIDALTVWGTATEHAGVFSYLRGQLERVARVISPDAKFGTAWAACDTWKARKNELDPQTLKHLLAIASHGWSSLQNLFGEGEPQAASPRRSKSPE